MLPDNLKPHIDHARELHARLPVAAAYLEYYGYDTLFAETGGEQCDLEKLDAAGVRLFGCALANGGPTYFQVSADNYEVAGPPEWALEKTRRLFADAMADIRRCPRVRIVETAADLAPDDAGTLAVVPLISCHTYMVSLEALEEVFRLGLRISHAGGSTCKLWCRATPGIRIQGEYAPVFNDYGRAVVAKMNELGIVIDTAHLLDDSAQAIIAASEKPVIDGHTGSRTAVPHSRGLSDETLRMMAEKGGVAGIHFADHLFTAKVWGPKYAVDRDTPDREPRLWAYNRHLIATVQDPWERARLRKNREAQAAFYAEHHLPPDPEPPSVTDRIATVADMAAHIEHMVNVMGIDHVGLGGDVNGIAPHQWPAGVDHVGELPHLTAELLHRGWSDEQLEKFLSRNWYRVFGECLPS